MAKIDGLLLLHKPAGVTSFGALNPIKRALPKKTKVGHTGTLDKLAHGLSLILVGSLTRLNPHFSHLDKRYLATISFGSETDTLDLDGEIIKTSHLPDKGQLITALEQHPLGSIEQAPPLYSALHIDGKRAYQYARDGQEVEMLKRSVQLHHLSIQEIRCDEADRVVSIRLEIICGGGFYVRSFARDLAYLVASCATLTDLERTTIGRYQEDRWLFHFSLEDAILASEFKPELLTSAYEALKDIDSFQIEYIKDEAESAIMQGRPFNKRYLLTEHHPQDLRPMLLFNQQKRLLAQLYQEDHQWRYQFVVGGDS